MTILEQRFMETVTRNSQRIADALEKANELEAQRLAVEKEKAATMARCADTLDVIAEAIKYLR